MVRISSAFGTALGRRFRPLSLRVLWANLSRFPGTCKPENQKIQTKEYICQVVQGDVGAESAKLP